ncbi:MAG: glycerate kinase [Pseudomonadota bacterium]|nr:glycerate kinase [Pseudomonadota bacterium]
MKIVIAPQAFKGSLDAPHVAHAISRGVSQVFPHARLDLVPVADGGEGTVRALVQASRGRTVTTRVLGPLEQPVNATWGVLGGNQVGVIEIAAASGLPLIRRNERNPLRTTSYGTGELIRHALDLGMQRLIIGVGGSATNDGGAGMARALGAQFLDEHGQELALGGGALRHLHHIDTTDLDPRLHAVEIEVACDVNNPLVGPNGASYIYGPQKGADYLMAEQLDDTLRHFAKVLKRDIGVDVADIPGAGAAGGLGAGLIAFGGATLRPGVDIVFRAINLEERMRDAQLVFTGEGRMDRQDLSGKAPLAVAQLAHRFGIPCVAIVGSTGRDYHVVFDHGLDAIIGTVNRPMPIERAVAESARLITEAAMRACRLLRVGMRLSPD